MIDSQLEKKISKETAKRVSKNSEVDKKTVLETKTVKSKKAFTQTLKITDLK